jgi:hypothetical protein
MGRFITVILQKEGKYFFFGGGGVQKKCFSGPYYRDVYICLALCTSGVGNNFYFEFGWYHFEVKAEGEGMVRKIVCSKKLINI